MPLLISILFALCTITLVSALAIPAQLADFGVEQTQPPPLAAAPRKDVTLTVRSDGGGDFASVQAALDSLDPAVNSLTLGVVTLELLGTFRERVWIYSNFTGGVVIRGVGTTPLDSLIIFNVAGSAVGTFSSATLNIGASNVTLVNVAVANDAGGYNKTIAGQSVALAANGGDFLAVHDSALLGGQDTLYTGKGRLYLRNVYVNGSCDSLFGEGSAVFDDCVSEVYDTVTAHRGEAAPAWGGPGSAYLFLRSRIAPTDPRNGSTYLGRPWGPAATTVLVDCNLGAGIARAGWEDWGHGCTNHSSSWCANVTYAEFNSTGPGAAGASERVWWSQQLTPAAAAQWTPERVLGGWAPNPPPVPRTSWRAKDLAVRE